MTRRWTEEEGRALFDGIGSFGWSVLERRTGHSRREIWDRVRREFGGGGITRGSYSLSEAVTETGYSRTQLRRAAKALNQRWPRTAKGGNYLLTGEQLEDLVAWLQQGFWSQKHHLYRCGDCGTQSRSHFSNGLCLRCYRRVGRFCRKIGLICSADAILAQLESRLVKPKIQSFTFYVVYQRLKVGKFSSLEEMRRVLES